MGDMSWPRDQVRKMELWERASIVGGSFTKIEDDRWEEFSRKIAAYFKRLRLNPDFDIMFIRWKYDSLLMEAESPGSFEFFTIMMPCEEALNEEQEWLYHNEDAQVRKASGFLEAMVRSYIDFPRKGDLELSILKGK